MRVRVKPGADCGGPDTLVGKTGTIVTQQSKVLAKKVRRRLEKVRLDDGTLLTISVRYLEEV